MLRVVFPQIFNNRAHCLIYISTLCVFFSFGNDKSWGNTKSCWFKCWSVRHVNTIKYWLLRKTYTKKKSTHRAGDFTSYYTSVLHKLQRLGANSVMWCQLACPWVHSHLHVLPMQTMYAFPLPSATVFSCMLCKPSSSRLSLSIRHFIPPTQGPDAPKSVRVPASRLISSTWKKIEEETEVYISTLRPVFLYIYINIFVQEMSENSDAAMGTKTMSSSVWVEFQLHWLDWFDFCCLFMWHCYGVRTVKLWKY